MSTNLRSLQGTYVIDTAHSSVAFVARHAMITKVRGNFSGFSGEAKLDGTDPAASSVQLVIPVDSVETRNSDRDAHVKSADFFNAEKYPTITFKSTNVVLKGDESFDLIGDLTIKDVTKSVIIPWQYTGEATDPFGNQRVGFEGSVDVNRKDWGLAWNAALEAGGVLVGETVKLEFEVSAIKQP